MDRAVVSRESFPLANFCEALRLSFAAWVQSNTDRLTIFWPASEQLVSSFVNQEAH